MVLVCEEADIFCLMVSRESAASSIVHPEVVACFHELYPQRVLFGTHDANPAVHKPMLVNDYRFTHGIFWKLSNRGLCPLFAWDSENCIYAAILCIVYMLF